MRGAAAAAAMWWALGTGAAVAAEPVGAAAAVQAGGYVGSERCRECHQDKYKGWVKTFHATVIQDARKNPQAVLGDFSAAGLGFGLEQVDFTIGGHWDQRYMTRIGDEYYVLPKLWSVQARGWRPYNVWSWKKMPYSKYCKGCHVTGYDPGAKSVAEQRIGCEACHGAGAAHASSGGTKPIVNPRTLSEERRDMICAACHVRGQDPSGTYYFPVGYVPGGDLGLHYVPTERETGETNAQAIVRLIGRWKAERSANTKVKCEVCGIYGGEEAPKEEAKGALDFCFGCHTFKEKYAEHTHHARETQLVCFDCHVQQTKNLMNPQNLDIHSYGYFLVHADNCYDRRIEDTCAKCHTEKPAEWARRTVEGWRRPVELDH